MTIEEKLTSEFKKALKEKNQNVMDVIRQIKARVKEKAVAGSGRVDITEAMYLEEIKTYIKQLKKGIEELKSGGERAVPIIAKYTFEIEYLSTFLPQLLSPEETEALVKSKIAELKISSVKDIGRLMGSIMKENRDKIDPALTRSIAEKLLL